MFRQALRFGIVGLVATMSDAILYYAFTAGGLEVHAAKGLSYGIGVIVGFLGNTTWVFRTTRSIASVSFPYVALYTITLGINVALNGLTLHLASFLFRHEVAKALAFLVATGITTIVNFLGCSLLLSTSKRPQATPLATAVLTQPRSPVRETETCLCTKTDFRPRGEWISCTRSES
jgi:putative flippase GtrA